MHIVTETVLSPKWKEQKICTHLLSADFVPELILILDQAGLPIHFVVTEERSGYKLVQFFYAGLMNGVRDEIGKIESLRRIIQSLVATRMVRSVEEVVQLKEEIPDFGEMHKIVQTMLTDENAKTLGNCLAACLSTVTGIELEKFPAPQWDTDNLAKCCDFLSKCGWDITSFDADSSYMSIGRDEVYLGFYDIAETDSVWHVVVCQNGRVIHDPSPRPLTLKSPKAYLAVRRKLTAKELKMPKTSGIVSGLFGNMP